MPDFGIKVSQNGLDVKTVSDTDVLLSSKFNQYKILSQGTFNITTNTGAFASGSTSIAHNLGYEPSYLVYLEETAGSGKKFMTTYKGTNKISADTDNNNLNIYVNYPITGTGTPQTHNGYYFIFKDNLT